MSTKRRPIPRPPRVSFTPATLDDFRKMVEVEDQCTCSEPPCKACDVWWEQNSILCNELRLQPWQWPAVQHSDVRSPYPEGCEADKQWRPDLEAQARYHALAEAAGIDSRKTNG
jgi:hypothetical protein